MTSTSPSPVPISVVMPSYQQARFLREALDSILSQNYPHLEVVVVDGGSTDGSVDILQSYGNRIRWISEKDRGQSDALNKGFRMASHDVLGWLNSDDLYEHEALWIAGKFFTEHPETMWAFGDCTVIDDKGREIRKWVSVYKAQRLRRFSFEALLQENIISQMGVFFRKNSLKQVGVLNPSFHYSMDYDLWLRLSKKYPPGFLNAKIGKFRMYPTSKSMSALKKQLAEGDSITKKYAAEGHRWALFLHRLNNIKITIIYGCMEFWKRWRS